MFGYGTSVLIGSALETLVPPDRLTAHRARMARLIAEDARASTSWTVESEGLRRDGTQFPVELSVAAWRQGHRINVGTIVRDLSERHLARERARRLTHFDALSGLPNRACFIERVHEALTAEARFTVLKVGLDGFKRVNGALGMPTGDLVLVEAARRARDAAGDGALVARLGGDEFGILLDGDDPTAAETLAQRLVERMDEPFQVGTAPCHVGASVGVASQPGWEPAQTAPAVLRQALLALQQAKAMGGHRTARFELGLVRHAEERRSLEDELRGALARNEFELFYQPQFDMRKGRIVGCEGLLRWRHPAHGLLAPASFISMLETSEMASAVGRWILREACAFAATLHGQGPDVKVGINLFACQLRDGRLCANVTAELAATGLPPRLLELEITETTVLDLDDASIEPLRQLRQVGVGVAFDDYGTGYASLSLLKRYPLTRLKIDRDFVRDLDEAGDGAIVRAVVALGASLGLGVIAEGVETLAQASALLALGCEEAQGYLYGKPMSAAELRRLLAGEDACAAA